MRDQRVEDFRSLHVPGQPFVMPNPWDIGSAKVMAGLGAKALATTSSGYGFTLGLPDGGKVTRDQALRHADDICSAVSEPTTVPGGFGEQWARVANGLIETRVGPALLLDLTALIEGHAGLGVAA